MSEEVSCSSPNVISPEHPSVVYAYKPCQTKDVKWLYIENACEKFYRANTYDIGGTYINDVADFWFQYKIEHVADIFLLHLFVWNRNETPFSVAVGTSNILEFGKKSLVVFLQSYMKEFKFLNVKDLKHSYLTTYSFQVIDVESLKDKQLYIPVRFNREPLNDEIEENVKAKHDFGYLLKDPVGADFTIEVIDGFQFKVHQALLIESSEFFNAMFKGEMAEQQSGCLKLIDVSKEDFECVLEFIYTGSISDVENCNIFSILQLADRFNLEGLHSLCEYVLAQHLTADNALETLVHADIYNASMLKRDAMKIIRNNKSILKSREFKEIINEDLAKELCEFLID